MTLTPRGPHDARYHPIPGDTYTFAHSADQYRVEDVQDGIVAVRRVGVDYVNTLRWPLNSWATGGGTWCPGAPCATCAKSRSRKGACGDVPTDPTTCPRYYPRTGA